MNTIRAIETIYAGCRFRSRLEARWAVFFDKLGLKYHYEMEGFHTSFGGYLPDFFLPQIHRGMWVEIKPDYEFGQDPAVQNAKLGEVVQQTGFPGIIFKGDPLANVLPIGGELPGENDWSASALFAVLEEDFGGDPLYPNDCPYRFCICPWTGAVGIEFDGRGERVSCELPPDAALRKAKRQPIDSPEYYGFLDHGDKAYSHDHPRLVAAAVAARSARFEHGESGARAA